MGQVYRATDTNLDRQVAIKVLPDAFDSDADRLARFEREAKVLASLNHPNIGAIYGLEKSDDTRALVLELVEGPTLADRIAQGPIPVDEAFPVARQIAEALEAAHEQGVIHRDLKPANIKLKPDGTVKVLDFGLAKALDTTPQGDPSQSPTLTAAATQMGVIMGTAAYMSPEQARGKSADKRADIWAFGVVLYEMLAGAPLWKGATTTDLIAAAVTKEPDFESLPDLLHPRVIELLKACLEKDPRERVRDVGDVRLALKRASSSAVEIDTNSAAASGALGRGSARLAWGLFALALASGVALSSILVMTPRGTESAEWFSLLPPNSTDGVPPEAVIAPDGQSVVYRARNNSGDIVLWLQRFDAATPRELPGTEGAYLPFWSADGESIGFFAPFLEPFLQTVDLSGGEPRRLVRVESPRGADWNEEDIILVAPQWGGVLHTIPAAGRELTPVAGLLGDDVNHLHPQFLPGGRDFLFFAWDRANDSFGLYVGSLDSTDVKRLGDFRSRAEYQDGYLFYANGDELFARPFDLARLEFAGEPVPFGNGVGVSFGEVSMGAFSVVDDLLVYSNGFSSPQAQLIEIDREGRTLRAIGEPSFNLGIAVSPDEQNAVVEAWDPTENATNLWLQDLQNERRTKATFGDWWTGWGRWSPDGSQLLYWDDGLFLSDADGGNPVGLRETGWAPLDWSPDGRYMVMRADGGLETYHDIILIPTQGGDDIVYLDSPYKEQEARVAPNSEWLAYVSNEDGGFAVYVDSFPTRGSKRRVGRGAHPIWNDDSSELYYLNPDNQLVAVEVSLGASSIDFPSENVLFEAPEVAYDDRRQYAVLDNGQRFIFNAVHQGAAPRAITVVKNWKALLED